MLAVLKVLINKYNLISWCGSTVEQLTCNQQVVGSIPITSSNNKLGKQSSFFYVKFIICKIYHKYFENF